MKVLFIILGILALLVYGGLGGALGAKNAKQAEQFEKELAMVGPMGGLASKMMEDSGIPSVDSYKNAMMVDFVIILIFIFGMVALFLKSNMAGIIAAALIAITGIVAWLMQPDYGSGAKNGKPIAMIVMIAALVAALSIFMVQNANKKKKAASA